LDVIPKNITCH